MAAGSRHFSTVVALVLRTPQHEAVASRDRRHTRSVRAREGFCTAACMVLVMVTAVAGQSHTWTQARIRDLLEPPTRSEIELVRTSWTADRPLVTDARIVERGGLERDGVSFKILIFRHLIGQNEHFTAVFVPVRKARNSLPILVEIRGIRFDYPTRRIVDGPFVMSMLGDLLDDFVIVEPCLRGHELQAIKEVHRAQGDRRDSWDGAANDAAAALSLAISKIAAADPERVVSFGVSRGGGVALLHGERDRRVKAVVALSAPTDWFALMKSPEDDWGARIHDAASAYAGPASDRSIQFFEWFLQDRGHMPNAKIRSRMIASSAIYFANLLPPTLVHHGSRDTSIPSVNAAALNDRFTALGRPIDTYQVIIHENAGHLLKQSPAAEQTREFLRRLLALPVRP